MEQHTYLDGQYLQVLNERRIRETEWRRLIKAGRAMAPAEGGAHPASAAGILSRGTAAVRAFWELAFRPPQEQCC